MPSRWVPFPVSVGTSDTPSLRAGVGTPAKSQKVAIQSWNCDGVLLILPGGNLVRPPGKRRLTQATLVTVSFDSLKRAERVEGTRRYSCHR